MRNTYSAMENEMSFLEIDTLIKPTYYNSEDDTINDFLIPILKRTKIYKRQTYSFSSAFFSLINEALIDMINNQCEIYYIAGIELEPCDIQAIEEGLMGKDGLIEEQIIYEFGKVEEFIKSLSNKYNREKYYHRLRILSYLVSKDILNIKIGFVSKKGKIVNPERFKFHPKVMIFTDPKGNTIVASGSPNESLGAHVQNEETFDVFKSWENGALPHLETHIKKFEQFWKNESTNIKTIYVNKLIENKILIKYGTYKTKEEILVAEKELNDLIEGDISPSYVDSSDKWIHQQIAKNIFLEKKFGILEMATGTGKTKTALLILNELYETKKIDGAIITMFGTNLLDQWYDELCSNTELVIYRHYEKYKEFSNYLINPESAILLISKDFLGNFLSTNQKITNNKLLIFDEVHRMGSTETVKNLNGKLSSFSYRLGLSATPERAYDEEGNKFIDKQLGPVIFEFKLENAIKKGILCEFDYIPLFYEYDDEDKQKRKAAYARFESNKKLNPLLKKEDLYRDLSRIKKISKAKIPVFQKYLKDNLGILDRTIIFVEEKDYGELIQQLIINYKSDYQTFFAEDQKENLNLFSNGNTNCLLTCKRLSEGIDIKSIKNIILFSTSRAKLETIQRIGRCLRIDPDNPTKRAKIVDFIVKSDLDNEENDFEKADNERYLWLMELSKVKVEY